MILFKKAKALSAHLQKLRNKNVSFGFVPTMGALHNGHISLIKEALKECNMVVCSIFINPAQFNNKNDFEKYPVTIENDILLLETNKTDIVFLPSAEEIYPDGINNLMHFDLGYLENILEGYYRPGHFQGVCNVVKRLLDIVNPDKIYLGQKDYQQALVLKRMLQSFHSNINLFIKNTVREKDGLAMSSRNMRLNSSARKSASAIYEALEYIKQNIETADPEHLKKQAKKIILHKGFDKTDYVEICDAQTLLPLKSFDAQKKMITLAAAYINDVRLIDNVFIN